MGVKKDADSGFEAMNFAGLADGAVQAASLPGEEEWRVVRRDASGSLQDMSTGYPTGSRAVIEAEVRTGGVRLYDAGSQVADKTGTLTSPMADSIATLGARNSAGVAPLIGELYGYCFRFPALTPEERARVTPWLMTRSGVSE